MEGFVSVYKGDDPGEDANPDGYRGNEVNAQELKYKMLALTDEFLGACGDHLD
jgi:hypothetical protein